MKTKRAIYILIGGSFVGAGIVGLACSSTDTSSGNLPTSTVDSGHGGDSQTHTDAGVTTDSGGQPVDAGADCSKTPTLHPPAADGGIFCPFSAVDGGKNIYCPRTDQCCESPKNGPPSSCVTKGTACPTAGSTVWECEDPADCPGGQKCCAHSGDAGSVTVQQDSCGPYLSKFQGTRCAASCAAGELVVCESQAECTTGTCTAVEPKANQIGVCK